jgi:hypothetical protein
MREKGGGGRARPTPMHVLFQTTFMFYALFPLNLFFLSRSAAEASLDKKKAHMEPNREEYRKYEIINVPSVRNKQKIISF